MWVAAGGRGSAHLEAVSPHRLPGEALAPWALRVRGDPRSPNREAFAILAPPRDICVSGISAHETDWLS